MDDELKARLDQLASETLALKYLVLNLSTVIATTIPDGLTTIRSAYALAANDIETQGMATPDISTRAVQVVEDLRSLLGPHNPKPRPNLD